MVLKDFEVILRIWRLRRSFSGAYWGSQPLPSSGQGQIFKARNWLRTDINVRKSMVWNPPQVRGRYSKQGIGSELI